MHLPECASAISTSWTCSAAYGVGKSPRGPYVPPDSLNNESRYDVEAIVDAEWLRVVVELPDDLPDVIVVTAIVE